ncbi:hypothetical protein AXX17_AT2G04830 [Arabidopsis thaliana]|uniref:Uncharacterized protein n=1 Tax=Arabidopsis thaliana TaxID=3702 RepID=A0A178VSQ5_ARATH|nr:hypothetical protein AXX17_AT2G04830 [Arabidopsis thaliana]
MMIIAKLWNYRLSLFFDEKNAGLLRFPNFFVIKFSKLFNFCYVFTDVGTQ